MEFDKNKIKIDVTTNTDGYLVIPVSYSDNYNDFMLRYGHGSSG